MARPVSSDRRQIAAECDEPSALVPTPLSNEELALIAKALAHPARLEIVEQLSGSAPRMVQEIAASSVLAQSTVSEHLRILREAAVIVARPDGSRVWYSLCRPRLRRYSAAVGQLATGNEDEQR